MPVTLEVVEGEATITLGDKVIEARPGTWMHLPGSTPHSVVAKTPLVLLLTLLKHAG
jgi:quercetin dioxygenase-like cupin family protein